MVFAPAGGSGVSVSLAAGQQNRASFTIGVAGISISMAAGQTNHAAFTIAVSTTSISLAAGQTNHAAFTVAIPSAPTLALDAGQTNHADLTVAVHTVSPITATCPISDANVGTPYSEPTNASGGFPPYKFALTNGVIPPNLNLVCLGDSLTVGYPVDPTGSYPTQLGTITGTTPTNLGINGEQSAGVLTTEVPAAISYFNPTLKNIAMVLIGRNDLAAGPGMLPGLQSNVKAIVSALQAAGFEVIALTLTPSNFAGQPASFAGDRFAYNAWLLAGSSGADLICDSGDDPRLALTTNTTFYQTDQLHMTMAGYGIVAQDVAQTISGTLPPGLSLGALSGIISGIPLGPGPFTYGITITDSVGNIETINCEITVNASAALSIVCSLSTAAVGVAYDSPATVSGGIGPYLFSPDPTTTLPPGLSLAPDGTISGIPTVPGPFSFGLIVTDAALNTTTSTCMITVSPAALTLACAVGGAALNFPYSSLLIAQGGVPGYTWLLISGPLPNGMTLTAAGYLQGTPTQSGPFPYTAKVTDSVGSTAEVSCVLHVDSIVGLTKPLSLVDAKQFAMLREKGLTGTLPIILYNDNNFPNTGIHLHPIPAKADYIEIRWWDVLQSFADLDSQENFPEGFYDALVYNLAVQLAPSYRRPVSPDILGMAKQKKDAIDDLNAQILSGSFGESKTLEGPNIGQIEPKP